MADAPIGTIWSSSPCMIRVGTSNFFRSSVKSVSENALMQSRTLEAGHHSLKPERVPTRLPKFLQGPVVAVERHRQILEELRAVGDTPARMPSNTSIGRPPGLSAVFNISGGTAPISTALATRSVPWRPM